MPLSKPNLRNQIHTRKIHSHGFQRDDGLWDIESLLIDTKSYSFKNTDRGNVRKGEAIHNIAVRITINDKLIVQKAEAVIDSGPFNICGDITPAMQTLEGLTIKPGWRKNILQRLGGVCGCTHIVDLLLGPIATTAWQTVNPIRQKRKKTESGEKPVLLNSCHAFSVSSPVVKREWPNFYEPK